MVPADAERPSNERYWFLSAQETLSGCPFADPLGRYPRVDEDRAGIIGSASPPTATSGHQFDVRIAATTPKTAITDSAIQIIVRADPAPEFSALVMATML
jgi:hypothetical protein